jgi:uncharacterized SAM-binding protein YcdF (DUF218 family)
VTASGFATWISRTILLVSMAAVILVLADFLRFADRAVASGPVAPVAYADAVVAFTGRSNTRLRTAVALLEQQRAPRLLISGVDPRARESDVRNIAGGSNAVWTCCITLGRQARDTVGNARELRDWVGRSGVRSVILVTENFHMERAVLEVRAALPDLVVTPWPVSQQPFTEADWWNRPAAMRALAQEYAALSIARLRLFFRIDLKEGV